MAFINAQRNNSKFQNFVSAVLALSKAGESLESFTKSGIQQVHDTIAWSLRNLKPCTKQCSEQIPNTKRWCDTCQKWKEKLEMNHKHHKFIKWDRLHSWLWPRYADEILEVFINSHAIQPNLKDISTIFCLWNNCREFDEQIVNKSHSLRDIRNNLIHNECEITTEKRDKILHVIRQLLNIQEIKTSIVNFAEVMLIFDELEKQNLWFDQALFFRSMQELVDDQNKENQERIRNLENCVQSLTEKRDNDKLPILRRHGHLMVWIMVVPVVLSFVCLYMILLYRDMVWNNLPVIQTYGCLEEHPENAPVKGNFSMEHYLTPYTHLHGRKWLFDEVEKKLLTPNASNHGLLLIAEMGYGKTAFMKHVICADKHTPGERLRGHLVAYHICRSDSRLTRTVGLFIIRLVSMISINLRNFREFINTDRTCINNYRTKDECDSDMYGCFDHCVVFPLRTESQKDHQPLIIVIDAMDECSDDRGGSNNIFRLLDRRLHALPLWIQFLVSSRNISHVHSLRHALSITMLNSSDHRNTNDVKLYLQYINIPANEQYKHIKNFQILHFLLMQNGTHDFGMASDLLSSSELSLYRYYEVNFERVFGDIYEPAKDILNIYEASYEPLEEAALLDIVCKTNVHTTESSVRNTISKLYQVTTSTGRQFIDPHASFHRWLTHEEGPYQVDLRKGHHDIANYLINYLSPGQVDTVDLLLHISAAAYPADLLDQFKILNSTELQMAETNKDISLYHRMAITMNEGKLAELAHYHFKDIHHKYQDRTAAFTAAAHGNDHMLSALIILGSDINFRVDFPAMIDLGDAIEMIEHFHWGYGLLDIASQNGHTEVVDYLVLQSSYQFANRNGAGLLPIHLACKYGYFDIVYKLHAAFPWMLDDTCLYYSAREGFKDIVKYCLDHGIKAKCMPCNTTMYWLSANQVRMQGNSLSFTSKVVLIDDWRYITCDTALHAAVRRNHSVIVRILIERAPSSPKCFDRSGKTPIMYAIIYGYCQIGSFLMENKYFNPSITCKPFLFFKDTSQLNQYELNTLTSNRCPEGTTIVHLSAQFGRTWYFDELLRKLGYYSNDRDDQGCHPLHHAACSGSLDILKHFMENNKTHLTGFACSNGSLLIHSAAICGSFESVKFLLKFFRKNVTDRSGRTVIMYAVMRYNDQKTASEAETSVRNTSKIVEELHLDEKDLITHDTHQRNILHYALAYGQYGVLVSITERFSTLMKPGILSKRDVSGSTPVYFALKEMNRRDKFSVCVTDIISTCREHRQKYLMSPTEYAVFILLKQRASGFIKFDLNVRRVLTTCIYKNSFQLFVSTLKCTMPNLTLNDDEHILNKLIKFDISGIMTRVYITVRWLNRDRIKHTGFNTKEERLSKVRNDQNSFKECVNNSEFSMMHFLALHTKHLDGVTGFNELFFQDLEPAKFNTCYDSNGYNILERAIQGGNTQLVKFLLNKGFESSRRKCDLLQMTVTQYKFRNHSDKVWALNITSNNDIEVILNDYLIRPVKGVNRLSSKMNGLLVMYTNSSNDNLTRFLLTHFKHNIAKTCLCSDTTLKLSLIHYLAMQDYNLSIQQAVKQYGKSILSCENRHMFTPLYFAYLFNSLDTIGYIESHMIKLKMPVWEAEQKLIFTMQTRFHFDEMTYDKCFPFRLGSQYNFAKFRRYMMVDRCFRKIHRLLKINDLGMISELTKMKESLILFNAYNYLKDIRLSASVKGNIYNNRQMDAHISLDLLQRGFTFQTITDSNRLPGAHVTLVKSACSVLKTYFIRRLKMEFINSSNFKKNEMLKQDMDTISGLPLESVCDNIYLFMHTIGLKHPMKAFKSLVIKLKNLILYVHINISQQPFNYEFYLHRLTSAYNPKDHRELGPFTYFHDIQYTTSYRDIFVYGHSNAGKIHKASHEIGAAVFKLLFEQEIRRHN